MEKTSYRMNERIRELAHEAGLPTYNPDGIPTKLEKFADLIVQDCISQIALLGITHYENNDISWACDYLVKEIKARTGLDS